MTLAQAAQRAIQLGGIYDGHEAAAGRQQIDQGVGRGAGGPGTGGVPRKDNYPRDGQTLLLSSRASPKSKSMSKPASTTSWISSRTPTSAR